MRILLVCERMDSGGAETHILCLARGLAERGHRVFVVSSGGKMSDGLRKYGIPSIVLPITYNSPVSLLYCFGVIKKLMLRLKIDTVHAHTRRAALLCHYAARGCEARFVTTVHARFDMSGIKRRLSRWGERTVAVSYDLKAHLCSRSPYVAGENVTVIPNGVDTQKFSPSNTTANGKHIVFLSRLDSDCSAAAYALCRLSKKLAEKHGDVKITLGGGGDELENIARFAQKINIDIGKRTIRVVGNVTDVPSLLRTADVFVGVGRAAIEAMSTGVCVVAAGDEGFGGIIGADNIERLAEGNFCCRSSPKLTDKALYSSLCALLRLSTDERADMGKILRNYVLKNCSYKRMAQLCEGVYKSAERSPCNGEKILLCGYYGYGNLGDDMLLRAAASRARALFPAASVSALTAHGENDSDCFGLGCARRKSPLSVFCNIMRADTVIFGGGTLLQNATSRRSIWYYLCLIRLSSALGKRVLLWGNGIGEIRGSLTRKALAKALRRCEYIGLRDAHSWRAAVSLIGNSDRLHRERDLAYGKKERDMDGARYALNSLGVSEGRKYAIIALRQGEDAECMRAAVLYVRHCIKSGIFPIYVAMYPAADLAICKKFAFHLGGAVAYPVDAPTLTSLIDGACEVFSMRYHALVLADSCGTPYVAVGTQKKITEFGK